MNIFTAYKRYKLYMKVKRVDNYADFYVLLNGKLDPKSIKKFCNKYNLNENEKKIFKMYIKKEKISVIAKRMDNTERNIMFIIESIAKKTNIRSNENK